MSNGTKQMCSIIGWVGKAPEVNEKKDLIYGKIRVGTDGGRVKDKKSGKYEQLTTWLDITVFNNDANYCKKYVKEGDQIAFDINIRNNQWENEAGENNTVLILLLETLLN